MYELCRRLIQIWFVLTTRPRVFHGERFPEQGAAILASNHSTAMETLLIPSMVSRKLGHVAKRELFTDPRPLHRLVGRFIHWAGARPMDRTGGRASASSMTGVMDHLSAGEVVSIFPEGTRTADNRLYKGKTGVARLALASGAPVIPIGLINTRPRRVRWWPFPKVWHPEIHFGEPIDFSAWRDGADDSAVLRHVTDEVMAAIQDLTGQKYVDVYAASLRSATAAGRDIAALELPRPGAGRPRPVLRSRAAQSATDVAEEIHDE